MSEDQQEYEVKIHRRVERFLRRHKDLAANWVGILSKISTSPRKGARISHLKGNFHCNYRWREGTYRFIYEVRDEDSLVHVYQAESRGSVYGH